MSYFNTSENHENFSAVLFMYQIVRKMTLCSNLLKYKIMCLKEARRSRITLLLKATAPACALIEERT